MELMNLFAGIVAGVTAILILTIGIIWFQYKKDQLK